jgi:hypothetical protein
MLCKKSLSTVCWCHSRSQNCIHKDDCLKTDVHSRNSDMDKIDHRAVFWRPLAWIVPIHMWYLMSSSMALVLQLQLWHLHWLVTMYNLHSHVPYVLHFLCYRDAAPVVKTHCRLDDINQVNVTHIPMKQYQLDYYIYRGLRACHSIRYVYSITTDPRCA